MQFTFFREKGKTITHRVLAGSAAERDYMLRLADGTYIEPEDGTTVAEARSEAQAKGEVFFFEDATFEDFYDVLHEDVKTEWNKTGKLVDPDWGELDTDTGQPKN